MNNDMASAPNSNPNMISIDGEQQVMSRPNAATARDSNDERVPRPDGATGHAVLNGIVPSAPGPQDMDGETVTVESNRLGSDMAGQVMTGESMRLNGGTGASVRTSADAPSRVSVHGFLMGPEVSSGAVGTRDSPIEPASSSQRRSPQSFLSGVAKAVQALPAAVEGLVMGQSGTGVATQELEGYASAQSGSPDGLGRPPSERQVPSTPLLDEHTLQRLNVLHSTAPHLYQPEPPASTVKPPSTSSSDLQAEVRRQVHEFMAVRDEETRRLKSRVELLMSENQVLRQEIQSQMYSTGSVPRTGSQGGFAGWINRGIGTLIGGSPKPPTPQRALDFRPPLPSVVENFASIGFGSPKRDNSTEQPFPPAPDAGGPSGIEDHVPAPPPAGAHPREGCEARRSTSADPASRALDFDSVATHVQGVSEAPEPVPQSRPVDPLEVVLSGMAQLQGVVADLANSPRKENSKQEVIKPGVNSLPDLPSAGPEACLLFSDWLHASKPALSDISDTSEELWTAVLAEAGAWYARFLTMDPISRLTSKPVPSETVSQHKWARVSRRIETMILAACPASIREEISAARVTGLLQVVARLYVIYAPGGLSERELGLKQIQEPSVGTNVKDTIEQLRRWNRWCDRIRELGGSLPDCALRVKALERMTKVVLQGHPDVAFRINLTRAALQVDSNPDDAKVVQLHAQMLGELEAISHRSGLKESDKAKDNAPTAKIKGVEQSDGATPVAKNPKYGKSPPKPPPTPKGAPAIEAGSSSGVPCTFFVSPNGCKKGGDCAFAHNWNAFSASEKAQRCKTCGSKGHRANECRAGTKGEEKAKHKPLPANPKSSGTPKASDTAARTVGSTPPASKDISNQQIKTMLADAAQILQQAVPSASQATATTIPAVPISSPSAPPQNVGSQVPQPSPQAARVTQGVPVTLAALNAQIESLRALAQEHEVKMIRFTAETGNLESRGVEGSQALLDSGATHAVIPYGDKMKDLERVAVTLAGDSREEWFRTSGGTLVVPPPKDNTLTPARLQTILPLGALVQTLGCKVSWSKRKGLKVVHPVLGPLKTGVARNTCPYIQEEQALKLIGELESERLREFEQSVQAMEAELQQVSMPKDPTESLQRYVATGSRESLLQAVFAQPYLKQVPEAIKVKLCEELPGLDDTQGWRILKRLPLSRARRRSLLASKKWLVFLCSGAPSEADPLRIWCQERNLEYLGVDILDKGGKGWDLTVAQGVWSVLLWAAATGRIAAVLSSPPYRTWCGADASHTPRTFDDPWGSQDCDTLVFKESMIMVQDQVLWSIASVSRGCAIPYLKEIPASTSAAFDVNLSRMCPERFWDVEAWQTFQHWAKMRRVNFCQGYLGHSWLRPSVIGTNLDLGHLQDIPRVGGPDSTEEANQWCTGFKREIVDALSGKVKASSIEQLDQVISSGLKRNTGVDEQAQDGGASESSDSSSSEETEVVAVSGLSLPESEAVVTALAPAEREAWKAHLLRGHVPYRKDCRYCVEGAGLGMQHRKVKNPQAYTLSVDLFGPMPGPEKGRDEQSISGNPHLRFGLIGVFRLPRSAVDTRVKEDLPKDKSSTGEIVELPRIQDEFHEEYEPSEPGEFLSEEMIDVIRQGPGYVPQSGIRRDGSDVEMELQQEAPDDDASPTNLEGDKLEDKVRDLKSGVELITLRYFVGLKSKTGADVAAGIQQLVLKITQWYPLKILHCDPGTEFASDALTRWLPGQGIRMQTTIPTDKQSNGLAERTVGWFKSRARTLLSSVGLPANYWPLAMRWASEAHNRSMLGLPSIPAFGQPVLHKLKRPPGAQKELLTRWIIARYGAPHLTIPEGHVLVTDEGNLVASKGFRTGVVDPKALEEANMPLIQEEEDPEVRADLDGQLPEVQEEDENLPIPDRRLRDKTTVRFVDEAVPTNGDPEHLSAASLMDNDMSEASFLRIVNALERISSLLQDRRGNFTGRIVLGAYSHGGQRGVTSMCRKYPATTRFLNKFLKARIGPDISQPSWSTVMLMHASDVTVHRDHRNEWGSYNYATCVSGPVQLWVGPPRDPKVDSASISPDWDSSAVVSLGEETFSFDPRNYHAVRKSPDWVLVGYTPLGTKKLAASEKNYLEQVYFPLSHVDRDEIQVRVVRSDDHEPEPEGSSGSPAPDAQGSLQQDLQADTNTMLVGWDLSEGASRNYPAVDLPDANLYRFLEERGVEHSFQQLTFLGVEEPEDLLYLFMEDLVEFGIPKQDADRIVIGIHPPGTRRPDNPNNSALTTGEVRLYDREHRQIPWVIQNRTLSQKSPGPPVSNLGVVQERPDREARRVRWDDSQPEAPSQEEKPSSSSISVPTTTPPASDPWENYRGLEASINTTWTQPQSASSSSNSWSHDRWSRPASSTSWNDDQLRSSASCSTWDHRRWSNAASSNQWDDSRWDRSSSSGDWSDRWWRDEASRRSWNGREWESSSYDHSWEPNLGSRPSSSAARVDERTTSPAVSDTVWGDEWAPTPAVQSWVDDSWPSNPEVSAQASQMQQDNSQAVQQVQVSAQVSQPQQVSDQVNQQLQANVQHDQPLRDPGPSHVWEDEWTPESMPTGWVAPWTTTMPPPAFPDSVQINSSSASNSVDVPNSVHAQANELDPSEEDRYVDPPWLQSTSRPQAKMIQVVSDDEDQGARSRDLRPQSCAVTPVQLYEAASNLPQIGVHFPQVISLSEESRAPTSCSHAPLAPEPEVRKLAEASFTPNVEELLASLTGPLEVVHQVSPSEVKRHLEKWASPAQDELDSLEGMQAIKRHRGEAAKRLLKDPSVELLPAKGVFTVKPGKPFRRKVRVVSCGNFARTIAEDVLYASGAAAETLRTVLVYAGEKRRSAWATDIKNAFLLAPIPKTATKRYALKPPTILVLLGICDPSEVWEVCRALYGFKEAPKWWAQYRDEVLSAAEVPTPLGHAKLRRTISDDNLWKLVLEDNTCIAHILVYVDDLLILACRSVALALFEWIRGKWQCSELEQAQVQKPLRFLGVDLYEIRDEFGVCGFGLAQESYIDELVRSHNLSPCARALIPVPREWVRDAPPEEKDYGEEVLRQAQRITGELLWVSQRSRIDVCFVVGLMSSWTVRSPSFVSKLGLRVLAYLANTKDFRLVLTPKHDQEMQIFTDASFAPFSDRSISGIVVQFRGRCIFWKSRRQTLVSLSTAESELIAACEGVVLGQSIEALVSELLDQEVQKELKVDNVAAITLAEGGGSQRTRHLRVRASFLKEMIDKGALRVTHCPGEVQLADCLTKALPAPRLTLLNSMLGVGNHAEQCDSAVQAILATNRAFQAVDSAEGQGIMLILALMMAQMTPVASQDDDEANTELGLDLWIIGSLMAFSLLFVWELGKHCLRECTRPRSASVRSVQLTDEENRQRRERRQQAVRRAIERETGSGLRQRQNVSSTEEDIPTPSFLEGGSQSSSHVHVHLSSPTTRVESIQQELRPVDLRPWNPASSTSPSSAYVPPPPPPPIPVEGLRVTSSPRNTRTVGTQTVSPGGLTDQQMCELEVITTTSKTPGAVHIFPDCHALRNVTATNRRTFCRYCLQKLRQQGR